MEYFTKMAQVQSVLFIYLAVGFVIRKVKLVNEESISGFTAFILNVALPCMIFNSFDLPMDMDTLRKAGYILLISTVISLLTIPLGKLLYRNQPEAEKSVLQYGTLVSNAGFAGMPLVSAAFGPEALFYASIYLIPMRILMWSAGITLFTKEKGKNVWKKIVLNPCMIAVFLGMVRMLLGIRLPWILDNALVNIGAIASPLSIIVVGAILGGVSIKTVVEKNVLYLSFVRLILLPCLVLVCLRLLKADFLLTATSVVLVGMPVGANTTLLAKTFGANDLFASKCVFVSTVLSLVTVPLLTLLL